MPTAHLHRLIVLIPAARRAALNTWFAANLDEGGDAFTVGLSATGNDPATHYWNNRSYTPGELKKLMQRLCNLANISPPADWDTMTRHQRKQWLLDQRPAIRQATGVRFAVFDNDGQWDSPQELLASVGLKTIQRNL